MNYEKNKFFIYLIIKFEFMIVFRVYIILIVMYESFFLWIEMINIIKILFFYDDIFSVKMLNIKKKKMIVKKFFYDENYMCNIWLNYVFYIYFVVICICI